MSDDEAIASDIPPRYLFFSDLVVAHFYFISTVPVTNAMVGMKVQPGGVAMPSGPHIVQGYHPYKR